MTATIDVKWNKQLFPSVALPTTSDDLKHTLRALTGVLEDKQTLMCKQVWKGVLGDGVDLTKLLWPKEKTTVVMMGTPTEKATVEPTEKVVFLEDLSLGAQAKTGKVLPPGLHNLGNTCYLNATVQVLKGAPELVQAVVSAVPGRAEQPATPQDVVLVSELSKLFNEMGKTTHAEVVPAKFVSAVRQAFPRFGERSPQGHFAQQDADEFCQELMGSLGRLVKNGQQKSVIDDLFGVELSVKTKCIESDAEPESTSKDSMRRLQCFINTEIGHLSAGIKLSLEGEVEKHSDLLNRNAVFHQTKRLSRAPKYLIVQLNRFFWKVTPESMDHRGVNCKILRSVKFPKTLDVFEFCDDGLQCVLKLQRDLKVSKIFDKDENGKKQKQEDLMAIAATDDLMEDEDAELQKALAMSMVDDATLESRKTVLGSGVPDSFSGKYDLIGVVSHKGRAANSGHYMGWVRNHTNPNKWTCFDDDFPSECEWQDIDNLSGGGDHHMAFLLMYQASSD